jgi:hypothetical protein
MEPTQEVAPAARRRMPLWLRIVTCPFREAWTWFCLFRDALAAEPL